MNIEWTEPALADLTALHDYIARDSGYYATQFVSRILGAVTKLEAFPEMGRRVPESDQDAIREILFQSYRIIYRLSPQLIQILAVLHGSRDLSQSGFRPWEAG